MLQLADTNRSYDPETVATMTAAYDRVCQSLSAQTNDNDALKQTLALIILRHVDQGERDPEQLAGAAFRESAAI